MTRTTQRYSDEQLAEFKELIVAKMDRAKKDMAHYVESCRNDLNNGTDDTSSTFKSFDDGANVANKEASFLLASRQEKFIRDLKDALNRIETKTYGICRVTGTLINPKRLELVPHATLSIKGKNILSEQ